MSEPRFNIIFKGEVVPGADEATVKANVGKLFKANDKVLARLFSGNPIEIKKNVDRAATMKYRALLKKAGAICYAQEIGAPVAADKAKVAKPVPTKPVPQQPTPAKPKQPTPEKVAVAEAKPGSHADKQEEGDDWSMAPTGADLFPERQEVESIPIPDISSISIAEAGIDLLEDKPEVVATPLPDISNIDIAEVGSDMGEIKRPEGEPPPDTSAIDLAPVGSDVGDPVEVVATPIPDISSIDIAPVGETLVEPAPDVPPPDVDLSSLSVDKPD